MRYDLFAKGFIPLFVFDKQTMADLRFIINNS